MVIEFYSICYKMVMFSISRYLYYSLIILLRVIQILLKVEFKQNWFLSFDSHISACPLASQLSIHVLGVCIFREFCCIEIHKLLHNGHEIWGQNVKPVYFIRSVDLVSCFTGHPDFRRYGICYGHASGETLPRCQDNRNLRRN